MYKSSFFSQYSQSLVDNQLELRYKYFHLMWELFCITTLCVMTTIYVMTTEIISNCSVSPPPPCLAFLSTNRRCAHLWQSARHGAGTTRPARGNVVLHGDVQWRQHAGRTHCYHGDHESEWEQVHLGPRHWSESTVHYTSCPICTSCAMAACTGRIKI